jgi:hypothetical protein
MTFSIAALVLVRDSHINPDSEAGGLIWVEGIVCYIFETRLEVEQRQLS